MKLTLAVKVALYCACVFGAAIGALAVFLAHTAIALALSAAAFVCGVAAIFLGTRALLSRIEALAEAAETISRGKLDTPVPEMGDDELGRMADALERLRESERTGIEMLSSSRGR